MPKRAKPAKSPQSTDSIGSAKPVRSRKPKVGVTVPPSVDSAPDSPSTIASESPAPDRILPGAADFSALAALAPLDASPSADASQAVQGGPIASPAGPTLDEIRERAYHRYLARGGTHGAEVDDWLEAERELRGE